MPAPYSVVIATLFPNAYPGPLGLSLCGKALARGIWRLETVSLTEFAGDKRLDDATFGGGSGMVIRPEPCAKAMEKALAIAPVGAVAIYPTPRGRPITQKTVRKLAKAPGIVFLCGRYEAVDQRVIEEFNLQEISIGDFLLASGDVAAIAIIEAVVRLIDGVIANAEATKNDSFENGLLEYPHYTRPAVWRGKKPPPELLSGDHARIQKWRKTMAEKITRERRPDLWEEYLKENSKQPVK